MQKQVFYFVFVFVFFQNLLAQFPDFYRERVELQIEGDSCKVIGTYYFKNTNSNPIKRSIYYPVSDNYNLSSADLYEVEDLSNGTSLSFSEKNNGIFFVLDIPAREEKIIRITFVQETPQNCMEYILTTTQAWGKPFEQAEYVVRMAKKISLDSLSLNYDYISESQNYQSYFITKQKFMPQDNFFVSWREK